MNNCNKYNAELIVNFIVIYNYFHNLCSSVCEPQCTNKLLQVLSHPLLNGFEL